MDLRITTKEGGVVEINDVVDVQIADGPIAPDFIQRKIIQDELSPDGTPITITPKE